MTLSDINEQRIKVSKKLEKKSQASLGQFFTPMEIATFMASWFLISSDKVKLLDPGAGIGSLSTAFLDHVKRSAVRPTAVEVTAYEIDGGLVTALGENLKQVGALLDNIEFKSSVINDDFILDIAKRSTGKGFTHAILNPPYKKIASNSAHRHALRKLGIECSNLYAGFLAIVLKLLEEGGQAVAIIPRSFCNGSYFFPFRQLLLATSRIKRIHLFDSRSEPFNDNDVLQENVILFLEKNRVQDDVIISRSTDATFQDLTQFIIPFDRVVKSGDSQLYIHIPEDRLDELEQIEGISFTLNQLGIGISTGPVVDFRLSEHLSMKPMEGTVPLLYPQHFAQKELNYPTIGKKPNAISLNDQTARWLLPNGYYTVTKRFSSKEESQRIVARVINPNIISGSLIGIENKINFFHIEKNPLPPTLAYGLAAYLNAGLVDRHFRMFSGHTQVNATDLKQMRYPSIEILQKLGEWAILQDTFHPQLIDEKLKSLLL